MQRLFVFQCIDKFKNSHLWLYLKSVRKDQQFIMVVYKSISVENH